MVHLSVVRKVMGLIIRLSVTCSLSGQNPVITSIFTADPAALVYGDSVYLYTGHDEASVSDNGFRMYNWHVFSSGNMVNWHDFGPVLSLNNLTWATANAWAGQCIERDGKFYWYVPMSQGSNGFAIGVAVADHPWGPFKDTLGVPLITNNMTTNVSIDFDDIDPTVFIDDDGQAYLFWGNTSCKWVKLKDNMIELDGPIHYISLPAFTEAPWIHKRDSIYYLSYASGYPETINYAISDSITGPWETKGIINQLIKNSPTNHQSIIKFKSQWYFIYHTAELPTGGEFRRSVAIDYMFYNPDGSIMQIVQTREGVANADSTLLCPPVSLKPLLKVNGGDWTDNRIQTLNEGDSIVLSPQVDSTGTWSWEGPLDYDGSAREISLKDVKTDQSGLYIVSFTNNCGTKSYMSYNLTINPKLPEDILSGDSYVIKQKNSNLAIIVQNSATSNGSNVIQGTLTNSGTQSWRMINVTGVYWKIVPVSATSKALDVYNASGDDGANAVIWDYTGGANQQWLIIEQDSGIYQIKARHSGKCLDVDGTTTSSGANVRQWTCDNSETQQFQLLDVKSITGSIFPEIKDNQIKIYPNPVTGRNMIIDVSAIDHPGELTITDINGRIIFRKAILDKSLIEPELNLIPGVYFVTVKCLNGICQGRFTVK